MHRNNLSSERPIDYRTALLEVVEWQRQKLIAKNITDEAILFDPLSYSGVRTQVDLRPEQAIDHTDMQSRDFNEGPGEIDMLIGFFFMNGACIVFFLMFGMCVICSCMRRRPRLFRHKDNDQKKTPPATSTSNNNSNSKTSQTKLSSNTVPVTPVVTTPAVKSNFKSFVSKAMKNPEFYKIKEEHSGKNGNENDEDRKKSQESRKEGRKSSIISLKDPAVKLLRKCSDSFKECRIEIEEPDTPQLQHSSTYPVRIHVECTDASSNQPLLSQGPAYTSPNHSPNFGQYPHEMKNSLSTQAPKASPEPVEDIVETISVDMLEAPSIVRQNLLGPLTFDDLYYT